MILLNPKVIIISIKMLNIIDEIFEELFEMTIFIPFPNDILMGSIEKGIPEILISTNLKEKTPKDTDFSLMVCHCSQILNTCIHEHVKHYLEIFHFN